MERGAGAPRPPGQLQPHQRPPPQQSRQQAQQQFQQLAQQGDYSSRLAPSYTANWQGGPPPNQQGYNPQMFVPGVGYDPRAANLAAVAAAQHPLNTPARPPQPTARSERFQSDTTAMPPPGQPAGTQPGGPYGPRIDMPYANAVGGPAHGWSAQRPGETLSPARARGDNGNGSRPGTAEGSNGLLSPVQVKSERDIAVEPPEAEEEKVDHRKRKRNRTIRSCVPCHNHKRKVSPLHH